MLTEKKDEKTCFETYKKTNWHKILISMLFKAFIRGIVYKWQILAKTAQFAVKVSLEFRKADQYVLREYLTKTA